MKKQAVMYFHWSMQDFDDADYFEMLEMMSAKDQKIGQLIRQSCGSNTKRKGD